MLDAGPLLCIRRFTGSRRSKRSAAGSEIRADARGVPAEELLRCIEVIWGYTGLPGRGPVRLDHCMQNAYHRSFIVSALEYACFK